MLAPLANLLVVLFALDAGLSLVEEGLRQLSGSAALLSARNGVALLALLAAPPALVALAVSPRLPAHVLAPLGLALGWLALGAAPLPMLFASPEALAAALTLIQATLAVGALLAVRRFTGGESWLFTRASLEETGRPRLSWRRGLGVAGGCALAVAPVGALYGLLWLATQIHLATGGFVSFDLRGVTISERVYLRGDREVRLVGMMHIGDERSYRDLYASFATDSTLVLEEGVSNDGDLPQPPLSYGGLAGALGLQEQPPMDLARLPDPDAAADGEAPPPPSEWPHLRHADVDLADFSEDTRVFLARAADLWDGEDMREGLDGMIELLTAEDAAPALVRVEHDLLTLRNERLLLELFDALPDYRRIVVPWGGLHLPAIEAGIVAQGFERSSSQRRRLLTWSGVLSSLF